MEVLTLSRPLPIGFQRYLISTDKRRINFISIANANHITLQPPAPAGLPAGDSAPANSGGLKPVFELGKDIASINTTGDLLLTGLNSVTAPQIAGVLQQYHFINDPNLSLQYSNNVIASIQTNGVHAAVIGVKAGAITFTIVNKFRPEWPLPLKATLAALTAVAVGTFVYFSAPEKKASNSDAPVATEAK